MSRYDTNYIEEVIYDFSLRLRDAGVIDPRLPSYDNLADAHIYWDEIEEEYDEDRLLIEGLFGRENLARGATPPDSPRIIDAIRNGVLSYVVRHAVYEATGRALEES